MKSSSFSTQDITRLISQEHARHQDTFNLIASENYPSLLVRSALASNAGTKYAEGYPGKRYYAGCAVVDDIERYAQQALLDLFIEKDQQHLYHANVQPHAGSAANAAVYDALLKPGDTILSMSLIAGGHLTHGHHLNFSGKQYKIVSYGVDEHSGCINYEAIERLAQLHKPNLIIAGASAYPRTIDFEAFGRIARSVNALLLADIAHIAGLIAGGVHPSPIGHAAIITSTTHKTLRGPRGAFILSKQEYGGRIDKSIMPGLQGGPFMHAIAARAYAFLEAQTEPFRDYAISVQATARALCRQLVAHGYHIVSGGTDTHLLLIDLSKSAAAAGLTGIEAEARLEAMGIVVNRNLVPGDARSPLITSGIRLGTAAMASRGMTEQDIPVLADCIHEALTSPSPALAARVKESAQTFKLDMQ